MFNTTTQNTKINIPATGIIQRSNQKSFFLNLQSRSKLANDIFSSKAEYNGKKISILQVLLMSEDWLLCEIVYNENL
jgi:hypothetical protein